MVRQPSRSGFLWWLLAVGKEVHKARKGEQRRNKYAPVPKKKRPQKPFWPGPHHGAPGTAHEPKRVPFEKPASTGGGRQGIYDRPDGDDTVDAEVLPDDEVTVDGEHDEPLAIENTIDGEVLDDTGWEGTNPPALGTSWSRPGWGDE